MELVRRLCPRILVIDAGCVLAEGPPSEVLARKDVIDAYIALKIKDVTRLRMTTHPIELEMYYSL